MVYNNSLDSFSCGHMHVDNLCFSLIPPLCVFIFLKLQLQQSVKVLWDIIEFSLKINAELLNFCSHKEIMKI